MSLDFQTGALLTPERRGGCNVDPAVPLSLQRRTSGGRNLSGRVAVRAASQPDQRSDFRCSRRSYLRQRSIFIGLIYVAISRLLSSWQRWVLRSGPVLPLS